jgi:hypothetical protein
MIVHVAQEQNKIYWTQFQQQQSNLVKALKRNFCYVDVITSPLVLEADANLTTTPNDGNDCNRGIPLLPHLRLRYYQQCPESKLLSLGSAAVKSEGTNGKDSTESEVDAFVNFGAMLMEELRHGGKGIFL